MIRRPSLEEAIEAEHALRQAILKFSDEARHPSLHGTPDPDPHWKPRPSTMRYSYIKGGGWAWSMDADDPQIVAFAVKAKDKEPFTMVTAHGHARHNFRQELRDRRIYPTMVPWAEWYDYRQRYAMEQAEPRRRY